MVRAQSTAPSTAKALPGGDLRNKQQVLDSIEQLAKQILQEVFEVRSGKRPASGETKGTRPDMQTAEVSEVRPSDSHAVGETRGMWRAMQPLRRP